MVVIRIEYIIYKDVKKLDFRKFKFYLIGV